MKTPIILLHGALGSKTQFSELETLCSKDFTVYSFDFSGHGDNAGMAHFSIDLFVEELFQFMKAHELEKLDIFGYSMGGYVALKAALQHPERLGKIIALGTKFDWNIKGAFKEVSMLNPDVIRMKIPAFADSLKQRHHATGWRTNIWRTSLMMLQLGNQPAFEVNELSGIENEVFICLGALDKMVSSEESEIAARYLKNGRFLQLENTQHPIEKVDSEKLAVLIKDLLQR